MGLEEVAAVAIAESIDMVACVWGHKAAMQHLS